MESQIIYGTIIFIILVVAAIKLTKALKVEKEKLNINN
tara:strand:+ start:336 stop:449 length:114 start_codon:yes stop_codon:yes gene_type:complete